MCVCMYACMYVCVYICMYVRTCVHAYVRIMYVGEGGLVGECMNACMYV